MNKCQQRTCHTLPLTNTHLSPVQALVMERPAQAGAVGAVRDVLRAAAGKQEGCAEAWLGVRVWEHCMCLGWRLALHALVPRRLLLPVAIALNALPACLPALPALMQALVCYPTWLTMHSSSCRPRLRWACRPS